MVRETGSRAARPRARRALASPAQVMAKLARVRWTAITRAEATAQATRAVATTQATRAEATAQATREAKAAHGQPAAWATGQLGPRGTCPLHDPCSDRRCQ
jgi:hypothetical protein